MNNQTNNSRPLIPVNPKGLEEIAAALLAQSTPSPVSPDVALGEFPESVRRNPRDYILVPEKNIVMARRQSYDGLNWKDAIKTAHADKLRLPRIDEMMKYFLNAREASNGKKQLLYADGSPVSRDQAVADWNYVSSRDRSPFANKPFWTWLDAKFENLQSLGPFHSNHTVIQGVVKPLLRSTLDVYAGGNKGWAELSPLSKEGLPKNNSSATDYVQGQNLYFWRPVSEKVAGFVAGSVKTGLSCDEAPSDVDSRLGVLACAAPKK